MTFLILICTLPERVHQLKMLTNSIDRQKVKYNGLVDWKAHDGGRSLSTGRKRNMLIEQTESDYFSFCDDDDMISDNYVDYMMAAIVDQPDVITFKGWMTTNGTNRREFTIRLGSNYEERHGHYYRFPNHLCNFRREKVRHIKFPEIWEREDYAWAREIHDKRILKTEVHIDYPIYHYQFSTNKPPYVKATGIRK